MTMLRQRRSTPQARGLQNRRRMLEAARKLLETHDLRDIALADVAEAAGVATSSAYHFYADMEELLTHLQTRIQGELIDIVLRPLRQPVASWQDVISRLNGRGVRFYNSDAAARQLQIGPRIPPELKMRDRRSDAAIGSAYEQHVGRHFVLPALPQRSQIFFRAVEIADLMFCLSLMDDSSITAEMQAEAGRACIAYLGTYLPVTLPRR